MLSYIFLVEILIPIWWFTRCTTRIILARTYLILLWPRLWYLTMQFSHPIWRRWTVYGIRIQLRYVLVNLLAVSLTVESRSFLWTLENLSIISSLIINCLDWSLTYTLIKVRRKRGIHLWLFEKVWEFVQAILHFGIVILRVCRHAWLVSLDVINNWILFICFWHQVRMATFVLSMAPVFLSRLVNHDRLENLKGSHMIGLYIQNLPMLMRSHSLSSHVLLKCGTVFNLVLIVF